MLRASRQSRAGSKISALLPMSGAMPIARTLLIALLLSLFAAPAQAWPLPVPIDPGAVEIVDPPVTGGNPLDDLLDILPPLQLEPEPEPLLPATTTIVPGKLARLRTDGRAAIPRDAPKRVRRLIAQYNRIVGKRYRWGGGHAVVEDRAYDCSGAVGYGLIRTGMLDRTMVSGSFARWAAGGEGRWVTIYANREHVYTELAGLRLDTSPYGDPDGAHGVRWRPVVGPRRGFKVRHPVGL